MEPRLAELQLRDTPALLLVGHGTRDEQGLAEFLELAELVARLEPRWRVATSFLELASPTIWEAVDELVAQGVRSIVVAPLLLLAAGHAKRDIPATIASLAARHSHVVFHIASHLGLHEKLLQLSAQRFCETTQSEQEDASDTLLVLVARGSYDAEALAEMADFASARSGITPVGQVRVAYLSMAEPSLEEVLRDTVVSGFPRIVVQPHLLFSGDLLARLRREVQAFAEQSTWQQWLLVEHLGPARLVAEAIWERARAEKAFLFVR